jgi:hypothetical protein
MQTAPGLGRIFDKLQVKIYTSEPEVKTLVDQPGKFTAFVTRELKA